MLTLLCLIVGGLELAGGGYFSRVSLSGGSGGSC